MNEMHILGKKARELIAQKRLLGQKLADFNLQRVTLKEQIICEQANQQLIINDLILKISEEKNPEGRPAFPNDGARKAELIVRCGKDKKFLELEEKIDLFRKKAADLDYDLDLTAIDRSVNQDLINVIHSEMEAVSQNPRITIRYAR